MALWSREPSGVKSSGDATEAESWRAPQLPEPRCSLHASVVFIAETQDRGPPAAFRLDKPIRSGSGRRRRGLCPAGLSWAHRRTAERAPMWLAAASLQPWQASLGAAAVLRPAADHPKKTQKGKGRSVRKLSIPRLSSLQGPSRDPG